MHILTYIVCSAVTYIFSITFMHISSHIPTFFCLHVHNNFPMFGKKLLPIVIFIDKN